MDGASLGKLVMNMERTIDLRFTTVSKDLARSILKATAESDAAPNRSLKKAVADSYRAAMDAGNWDDRMDSPILLSGSSLEEPGLLFGGQHRMNAFISSKVTEIVFPILFGATEGDRQNQDTHANRSVGDRMAIVHATRLDTKAIPKQTVVALVRLLFVNEGWNGKGTPKDAADPLRMAEIQKQHLATLQRLDAILVEHRDASGRAKNVAKQAAVLAGFVEAIDSAKDPEHLTSFFAEVVSKDAPNKSAGAVEMREYLVNLDGNQRHMKARWDAFKKTMGFCADAMAESVSASPEEAAAEEAAAE